MATPTLNSLIYIPSGSSGEPTCNIQDIVNLLTGSGALDDKYVTLDTDQDISANKTFVAAYQLRFRSKGFNRGWAISSRSGGVISDFSYFDGTTNEQIFGLNGNVVPKFEIGKNAAIRFNDEAPGADNDAIDVLKPIDSRDLRVTNVTANDSVRLELRENGTGEVSFRYRSNAINQPIRSVTGLVAETFLVINSASDGADAGKAGVLFTGVSNDVDTVPLTINGYFGITNPTNTTPAISLVGAVSDGGTNVTTINGNETIFKLFNNDVARISVLGNGNTAIGPTDADTSVGLLVSVVQASDTVLRVIDDATNSMFESGTGALVAGGTPNVADSMLIVYEDTTSNRSINAAGTVNASGTDYAEYETKRDDCGVIAKGDIVGFDENGLLTDKFSLARSFAIKSTAPSYVGGDDWANSLTKRPERPEFERPVSNVTPHPGDPPNEKEFESINEYLEAFGKYEETLARHNDEYLRYVTQLEIAEKDYNEQILPRWEKTILNPWLDERERLRQTVDRIAYAGKVPVNVTRGAPGDYVIAKERRDGGIGWDIVDAPSLTMETLQLSVGKIKRVLPDGRREVIVKMGF
jgi:hypothetical protein